MIYRIFLRFSAIWRYSSLPKGSPYSLLKNRNKEMFGIQLVKEKWNSSMKYLSTNQLIISEKEVSIPTEYISSVEEQSKSSPILFVAVPIINLYPFGHNAIIPDFCNSDILVIFFNFFYFLIFNFLIFNF